MYGMNKVEHGNAKQCRLSVMEKCEDWQGGEEWQGLKQHQAGTAKVHCAKVHDGADQQPGGARLPGFCSAAWSHVTSKKAPQCRKTTK